MCLLLSSASNAQQKLYNSDSTLSRELLASLCDAASKSYNQDSEPLELERLISLAAGTSYLASDQGEKIYDWWTAHYGELYCRTKKRDSIHLGRLIIENDIREISNQLGPNGRLSINVEIKDLSDSLTLREYAKREREKIQERYNNETLKFQANKRWKNYTFYMLLFTEYEVQWSVKQDLEKN